tara:strand:+ start:48274 stop:49959 length:1686 start_codon:yes stop_codon:yes gene_type:complete
MYNKLLTSLFTICLIGISCKNKADKDLDVAISHNPQDIEIGQITFEQHCSSCHFFGQDDIGPSLSGITRKVDVDWLKKFIRNPRNTANSGDERAVALVKKYKVYMPDFNHLTDSEIEDILAYLHTYEISKSNNSDDSLISIKNPIKSIIGYAKDTANLEFVGQVPSSDVKAPFTRINKLGCDKASGRIFINDLRGAMYELKNGKLNLYLSLKEMRPAFIDQPGMATGFGSFALHPEFLKNGLFYTTHTEKAGTAIADFTLPDSVPVKLQWVITEWKSKQPKSNQFSGVSREILRFDFVASSHGLQEIAFNPTVDSSHPDYGKLYIALGDGGAVQVGYPNLAYHKGREVWGSILRIDPLGNNSRNKKYSIPLDNPFTQSKTLLNEIWAYGFRNANRMSWDSMGRMLVSDIGQANIEELNVVKPGEFYGWPIREGRFLFDFNGSFNKIYPLPENDSIFSITYPIIQYDHDDGVAISGGFTSKGEKFKEKYIFGDIASGNIYISDLAYNAVPIVKQLKVNFKNKITTINEMAKSSRADLKFGMGCNGTIYIFTKADGKIYKLRE